MLVLSQKARLEIAATMNDLPFVKWDRFVSGHYVNSEDGYLTAYGWIDRADGRADFVLLEFPMINVDGELTQKPNATTSSVERSREIQKIVWGSDDGHVDCTRVESEFADLVENVAEAAA